MRNFVLGFSLFNSLTSFNTSLSSKKLHTKMVTSVIVFIVLPPFRHTKRAAIRPPFKVLIIFAYSVTSAGAVTVISTRSTMI